MKDFINLFREEFGLKITVKSNLKIAHLTNIIYSLAIRVCEPYLLKMLRT